MISNTALTLRINQQFAKIGMESELSKLEIRQPHATMEISQTPAILEINKGSGTLQIDSEDAWAALGSKPFLRFNSDILEQAKQETLEAIGQIAEEGDQLALFEQGNAIPDIALQRQNRERQPLNVTAEPSPVHVSYTPHPIELNWHLGGTNITASTNPPQINYVPGHLNVYVEQQNWLKIDVAGTNMNMQV